MDWVVEAKRRSRTINYWGGIDYLREERRLSHVKWQREKITANPCSIEQRQLRCVYREW